MFGIVLDLNCAPRSDGSINERQSIRSSSCNDLKKNVLRSWFQLETKALCAPFA